MSFKHFQNYIESDKPLRFANGKSVEQRSPELFDHFIYGAGALDSQVPQLWDATETGAATPFAPSASEPGGAIICVTGATTNNGQEVGGTLIGWQPSTQGTVVFEARAKFVGDTTATDGDFYFGLSDAKTEASSLPYVVSATSTLTTHAPSDAALFAYSSIPTSGALYSASGNYVGMITTKADTDTVSASTVVKDSSYHIYRVEINSSGDCTFSIDGTVVKHLAAAVTAATKYTPYCAVVAKNSHAHTGTIDYIRVYASYV
jgi:hypothetical protein